MIQDPAMFRALFETAPDAMVVVDRQANIVLVNPQAQLLFGHAESELLGQPIEMLMPESVRLAHRAHREGFMQKPRVRPMGTTQELIGLRHDGQQFPLEIALSPIETPGGQFFAASIRDVSETLRARQALARARFDTFLAQAGQLALESRLDVALEQLPILVASALAVEGVAIVFAHGKSGELQVRAAFGLNEAAIEHLPAVLAAGVAGTTIRSDCAGFAQCLTAPLFDRSTKSGALIALSRKPREFDRDALHFLQAVANLLAAVIQRNRTEEQLAHAQRLEAVGQLTGGIAHDFNNLLTVISGNLQLLEYQVEELPEAAETINKALRAVGRGAELTRKLLAFAGWQQLSPQAIEVSELLHELGDMLRRTLGEHIVLELECAPALPAVYADPAQLESALLNLALNARDAMPRGGMLRISADQVAVSESPAGDLRAGHYISFAVQDAGIGMAPDTLARAFEPFFTTKPTGKGSGLGLSMVYGFVTQSGGHLSVESQLGFGTRFVVYLPCAPQTAASRRHTTPATTGQAGGAEMVLVVEDEAEVREIATAFVRSLGYPVLAVASAEEALALLTEQPSIRVLFSDVILGSGMPGDELAREAQRQWPDLVVLLTSGFERTGVDEPRASESFELLRKPYRREQLGAALKRALERRD